LFGHSLALVLLQSLFRVQAASSVEQESSDICSLKRKRNRRRRKRVPTTGGGERERANPMIVSSREYCWRRRRHVLRELASWRIRSSIVKRKAVERRVGRNTKLDQARGLTFSYRSVWTEIQIPVSDGAGRRPSSRWPNKKGLVDIIEHDAGSPYSTHLESSMVRRNRKSKTR
jgi:hypothetical protein